MTLPSKEKKCLYKILELNPLKKEEYTLRDIKKQYHKLSLKYHPDKSNGKDSSEELFKQINFSYSILSDEQKRLKYDTTGEVTVVTGETTEGEEINWNDYFQSIKRISTEDLEEFKREYLKSKEEEEDLKKLYLQFNGNLMKIIENSYFGRLEEEERYYELLQKNIIKAEEEQEQNGLELLSEWRLLNRRERIKLKKKQDREERELEKIIKEESHSETTKSLSISNVKRKNEEMFDSLIAGLEAKYGSSIESKGKKKSKRK